MNLIKTNKQNSGAALLAVLFVVMAGTIISLGFLNRSDVELACGQNMVLRAQMDYLAQSGLEHAKGMLLNPQDVSGEYWTGASSQQLVPGSDKYYDVNVTKLGKCDYKVISTAYKMQDGEKTAQTSLKAELRLDPIIAFRTGNQWTRDPQSNVYGDIYIKDNLQSFGLSSGYIYGDVYADGDIQDSRFKGSANPRLISEQVPVNWPDFIHKDSYHPTYYIGNQKYYSQKIWSDYLDDISLGPSSLNPAGVFYHNGDLNLGDDVRIEGTLIVDGHLRVSRHSNVIVAKKNFPALFAEKKIEMKSSGDLYISGLAVVKDEVCFKGDAYDSRLIVQGALWVKDHNLDIDGGVYANVDIEIISDPDKAAVERWIDSSQVERWSPVGGAFYKKIERN